MEKIHNHNESLEIVRLKKELEQTNENLTLAASYGKQLLETNVELQNRIEIMIKENGLKYEAFEQEKYEFKLQLEYKESVIKNLESELESQEKDNKNYIKKISKDYENKIGLLNKKNSSLNATIEDLENDITIFKKHILELENQLEEVKEQREISILISPECSINTTDTLENEFQLLINEKQNLESDILGLKNNLKYLKVENNNLRKSLAVSKHELEENECKYTSLYNALEKSKETNVELQMEIENLKMSETDPLKKGNSIFSEVEDNRKTLEKLVISLKATNATLKEKYEIKFRQYNKLKKEMVSLMDVAFQKGGDSEYERHLEDSLSYTKRQLEHFMTRCTQLENELEDKNVKSQKETVSKSPLEISKENTLFKYLYEESEQKISTLQEQLITLRFANVSLNDKHILLQKKLHETEREKRSSDIEVVKMKTKLEELQIDGGETPKNAPLQELSINLEVNENTSLHSEGPFKVEKENLDDSSKEKENLTPIVKCVKMSEIVSIIDNEHKVIKEELSNNEQIVDSKKILKPTRKKMEAPHIVLTKDSEPSGECKMQ